GSVENLVKNTDKLKGKQKENVETYGQQGILSKELATIITDVPVSVTTEELKYEGWDEGKLKEIFNELEFRTLAKRIFGEPEKAPTTGKSKSKAQGSEQLSLFDTVKA